LSSQLSFPRNSWSEEAGDARKVGLFEVFRPWAGEQASLIDRFNPEAARTWIAPDPVFIRGEETYWFDKRSTLTACTCATLRTNVPEIVPVMVDFDVLASRADAVEPALHPGIATTVNRTASNSSASPNPSARHDLCAGSIFCDSEARVAVKLECTFIVPAAAAVSDNLQMDCVHGKAIGGDDGRTGKRFYQEAVKETLHIAKVALHATRRALSVLF